MAGLLDLLFGQGGGVLGNPYYGGPAYPNGGSPDASAPAVNPQALAAYAQGAPQAQPAPQMMPQSAPQGAPMQVQPQPQAAPQYADNPLTAMFPAAANAVYQRQMTQAALQSLPANMPFAQKIAILQNPKVQEWMWGAPVNNGTAKFANGTELPVLSQPGRVGQYAMPQDPTLRGLINAPVKLGDSTSKVGEISTTSPTLFQNGRIGTPPPPLPGAGLPGQPSGIQGAIDLNNKIAQQKSAAEAAGKAQGTNAATLPVTMDTMDMFLKNIDTVRNDPGLPNVVGALMGHLPPIGGKQADLVNRIDQLESETALQGFQQLKGAGRITQAEMFKAGEALARLHRVSSIDGFKSALNDLHDVVTSARTRAGLMAGGDATPPAAQSQGAAAPSFTQDQLRSEAIRRGLIKQ